MSYSLSEEEKLLIESWNDNDFDITTSQPPLPPQQPVHGSASDSDSLINLPKLLVDQFKIGLPKNKEEFELIGMCNVDLIQVVHRMNILKQRKYTFF